jgi:hypothetical protein
MRQVAALLAAAVGLFALIANKRFGEAAVQSSRTVYKVELKGGAERAMIIWGRLVAIVCGVALVIAGAYSGLVE